MKKRLLEDNKLSYIISVYENSVYFQKVEREKLSARKCLTKKSLIKMFHFLNSDNDSFVHKFIGIIPKNVISFNSNTGDISFTTNEQIKKLLFSSNFKIAEYKIPKLLWVYKNNSLSLFALKGNVKSENDFLYQAPFLNIDSEGSVCMGNTKFSNNFQNFEFFMKYLQEQFFLSVFTHTNVDKLCKGNLNDIYKMAESPDFNWNNYLLKTKLKIKDVLD